MDLKDIFILGIGKILELSSEGAKINGSVPSGRILVDGLGVGDVGNIVLRDRRHLSQDGLIVVVISIEAETGKVVAGPDIISRGFVYVRESEDLMEKMRLVAKEAIEKCEAHKRNDWASIKNLIRDDLRNHIYEKTKRKPMILPIVMEV